MAGWENGYVSGHPNKTKKKKKKTPKKQTHQTKL